MLYGYFRNYEELNSKLACRNNDDIKEYKFHVLTPIDASVLGTKEDLVEVILAALYQEFQSEYEQCKQASPKNVLMQDIIRNFDDAYKEYINVGKHDELGIPETSLARLKYISNSLKAKATLKMLVCNFLRLLYGERDSGKSYLVITIDDLDVSPENGYEMLEQLYKYFSNQKVIILVAIKYEQMKTICDKHFADCLTPEHGGIHKDVFKKSYKRAKKLSNDYLLKAIPLSNRVYMPEANVLDKRALVVIPEGENTELSVKEFILRKIVLKMNIFYDIKGLKKHFCLPGTVRELVTYNEFLDSLVPFEEIEKAQNKKMVLYDQNHERFNADIEFGMAIRVLDDEQLELFRLIKATDIERRARYTVSFMKSWMQQKGSHLKDEVDGQAYCYADLLERIYKLGREDYDNKPLVHCILASFTSEMEREYYSYRNNSDSGAKGRAAKRLKGFLGNTFGGNWFGEVAQLILNKNDFRIQVGYIPDAAMARLEIALALDIPQNLKKLESLENELVELVPCMECLNLLFSDFKDECGKNIYPKWEFIIEEGQTEDGEVIELRIKSGATTAIFDMLGFIGKEIVRERENKKENKKENEYMILNDLLAESIKQCLDNYVEKHADLTSNERIKLDDLKKRAESKSIWSEMQSDGGAVFPYYNLDMSYNIMKRVRKKLVETAQIRKESICDYFSLVYGYIAEELRAEEEGYKKIPGIDGLPAFSENFVRSTFIKAFGISGVRQKCEGGLNRERMEDILLQTVNSLDVSLTLDIKQHDINE